MALGSAIAVATFGCQHHAERAAIDGLVTFSDGRPIDHGSIEFSPTDAEDSSNAGAVVIHGSYHIPREKGLRVGNYLVRILCVGARRVAAGVPGVPGQQNLATPNELISASYNSQSSLTARVQSVEDQRFDFVVD